MPTLVDLARRVLGRSQETGIGFFRVGAGQSSASISQAWDFLRIASVVYQNPTGYRCVEAIASNISRPPWMILPEDAQWPEHGSARAKKGHPLLDTLNRPSTQMSGTQMQRAFGRDLELSGKSFWLKVPGPFGNGIGLGLRRLPAQRVTVVGNADDELLGFIYTDRVGRQAPILPENVVYLRYPHPERIYDGLAPGLVAGLPAEIDTDAGKFNRELLKNDAAIPGYLILQGLTPDQFQEWKSDWEKGAQPGRTRFLSGDQATYAKVGQTNQELTYKELRRSSQDDILRSFGVPRAVAFDTADTTYANADAERAMFMQQNILPKWTLIADELTLQLGYDLGVRVAFDLTGIDELQDSRDAVVKRATELLGYKVKTINEIRQEMGLTPVAWGDEPAAPLQPMSAVPLQPGGVAEQPKLPPAPEPLPATPAEPAPTPPNGHRSQR